MGNEDHLMSRIWKSNLHERLKMLLWRTADLLPSKETLSRYVPDIESNCPMCDSEVETTMVITFIFPLPICEIYMVSSQWGIKTDSFQLDFMQKEQFLLSGALALILYGKLETK